MSEENDIFTLTDEGIEFMAPSEAQGHIDRTLRAAGADSQHPYTNSSHFEHKKTVDRMQRLYSIASPEPEPLTNEDGEILIGQPSREIRRAIQEAENEKAGRQDRRIEKANKLFDELRELEFENVPDYADENVTDGDIDIWLMQEMHAKENYNGLIESMSKKMRDGRQPASVLQLFDSFRYAQADLEPKLKMDLSQRLIEYFHEANRESKNANQKLTFGKRK